MGRVEAVCSLLLQGTRPRFASDTLMSPASPLLTLSPSPGRWSSGCGYAVRGLTAGDSAWEECAGTGRGNTGVRYRRQLAGRRRLGSGHCGDSVWEVRAPSRGLIETGLVVAPCERAAQLYLPEATSGCPSSARAGAPAGAKEVYSEPSAHQSEPSNPTGSPT